MRLSSFALAVALLSARACAHPLITKRLAETSGIKPVSHLRVAAIVSPAQLAARDAEVSLIAASLASVAAFPTAAPALAPRHRLARRTEQSDVAGMQGD